MGSVMCGRRGAVGSATAEDVLAGKTFSSDKGANNVNNNQCSIAIVSY